MNYRMQIHPELSLIPEQQWNSLLNQTQPSALHPGLRYEYLNALEASGSACPETGWAPMHLGLYDSNDRLMGAMPMYLKSHSYGEYVFDWAWAQAYERHGLAYYPKLLCAIPFTPIQGPKLLVESPQVRPILIQALQEFLAQCAQTDSPIGVQPSSFHGLFLSQADSEGLFSGGNPLGIIRRNVVQFHWRNQDATTRQSFVHFDHYLSSLSQKKRKNIRAERRKVNEAQVEVKRFKGPHISDESLDFFYRCYCQTYLEHYSTPYLTKEFFERLIATMPESLLLCVAYLNDSLVASSLFLYNQDRLYGRYWGAIERIPCLHFEMCYYQGIEFAIEEKINWFEGGAQGEHKMARGLNPYPLDSAHWVAHPEFKEPIARFVNRETAHLAGYVDELNERATNRPA